MKDVILTEKYRQLDRDLALLSYRLDSTEQYESRWFVADDENIADARAELAALNERIRALDAPDAVYAAVKHHFLDFTESLGFVIDGLEEDPLTAFFGFQETLHNYIRLDKRPAAERLHLILERLQQFQWNRDFLPELLKARRDEKALADEAAGLLRTAAAMREESESVKEYFPEFSDMQAAILSDALYSFGQECEDIAGAICPPEESGEKASDDLDAVEKLPDGKYEELLRRRLGVELAELLSWYEPEMEKTRAEVFAIAAKACKDEAVPETMEQVNELLFRHQPPAASADEMYERARGYLKRTRAVAHEYVNLPEDEECVCVTLPKFLKDSYPWGGYEGGDFRKRPYIGQMFLNQYNVPNISDGWIKMNSMHEAYPGHHVQYVRAAVDPTPETVKIGAKLVPLLEGTCLRTERAFEDTFPEDPYYPLFVAYRRHHTSVRIFVDLQLFYFGATVGEAVDIYRRELGLDFVTARAQVQAHQNSPGYFTCYYYGMKKITDWERELGFTKKDFTELCFSAGYVSIETFGMLVRMTEEERRRYCTEFKSLLRE